LCCGESEARGDVIGLRILEWSLAMPRVLVIEDDVSISSLMSDALRNDGFEVDTAENGAVGMATLRERPPNMIVLDLMMPVMDGWEFMRRCREVPGCADRPILVMSAANQPALEFFDQCEFLAKPFELHELIEAVTRLAA
jgi:two-component system chemotaxis response regulator CheY